MIRFDAMTELTGFSFSLHARPEGKDKEGFMRKSAILKKKYMYSSNP